MYSPKISEDLIPELYRISKEVEKPMTKVVDDVLRCYVCFYKKCNNKSKEEIDNLLEELLEEKWNKE